MINIAAMKHYDQKQLGVALFGLYIINQGLLRKPMQERIVGRDYKAGADVW